MKVVCTTVTRHTKRGETHGHIYEVDWEKKKVVQKILIPKPKADSFIAKYNPRGGSRGGRGICITKDNIYVTNYNTIIKYDHNWNKLYRISNQLFMDIHEICLAEDGIWVTSTGIDLVCKIDFSGRVQKMWSPRTDLKLKNILGIENKYNSPWPPKLVGWGYLNFFRPLDFMLRNLTARIGLPERSQKMSYPYHVLDYESESRIEKWLWGLYKIFPSLRADNFHINSIFLSGNEVYATVLTWPFREKACVVRIEPSLKVELGIKDMSLPHNGQIYDNEYIIINDSGLQNIKIFKRETNVLVKRISAEQLGIEGKCFFRGLKQIGNGKVLVGVGAWDREYAKTCQSANPQILEVDINNETVLGRVILSNNTSTSIGGLDFFDNSKSL